MFTLLTVSLTPLAPAVFAGFINVIFPNSEPFAGVHIQLVASLPSTVIVGCAAEQPTVVSATPPQVLLEYLDL